MHDDHDDVCKQSGEMKRKTFRKKYQGQLKSYRTQTEKNTRRVRVIMPIYTES